jgi:hypothetical protein
LILRISQVKSTERIEMGTGGKKAGEGSISASSRSS